MSQAVTRGIKALLEEAHGQVETMTVTGAKAAVERDEAVIVDLRDPREIEREGRIPGSFSCTRGMLEFWIDPESPYAKPVFQQDKKFIFHCAGGWRSALAAKTALDMGLKSVAHLGGGFAGWRDAGEAVEKVGPRQSKEPQSRGSAVQGSTAFGYDVTTLRGRRADSRAHRLSMGDLFERMRWSQPDRVVLTGFAGAVEHPDHTALTVAQADDLANRCANAVLASGAAPGDVLVMACENSVEAILIKIAMAKAGVVVAPLNPRLAPDVVAELLALTRARWAIVDAEAVSSIGDVFKVAGLRTLATIALGAPLPAGHTSFHEFIADASAAEPDVVVHGDDIWQILFTSGTSAMPKGVMVSHTKTMIESLAMSGALTRGQRFESNLILGGFLPVVYHVGDITLYGALLAGGSAVLGRRADPTDLARAIDQYRITGIWAGSPQIIEGLDGTLRAHPSLDATSVTSIVHGFAPLAPSSYASLKESLGPQVLCSEIIGQTEVCCSHRFWLDEHDELYRRSSPQQNYVGLPHPTMACAIVRENGELIEAGSNEVGEAVYRSPALMAGYLHNQEATVEAFRGGWFHGGDAFREGEGGQRILVDRFKDIIKSGGENVSSIRVESTLMRHPAVARAAVVGLPHSRWGEAVTGFVRIVDGATCTEAELIAFAKSRLAGFETPKAVVFVTEFPEAVGNKIQKHKLRERHIRLYESQR